MRFPHDISVYAPFLQRTREKQLMHLTGTPWIAKYLWSGMNTKINALHIRNVSRFLPDCMAQLPKRQSSSFDLLPGIPTWWVCVAVAPQACVCVRYPFPNLSKVTGYREFFCGFPQIRQQNIKIVQWSKNNCELCHSKRGRKNVKGKRERSGWTCLNMYTVTGKNPSTFNCDISGTSVHQLLHCTVFDETKELYSTQNADTRLNTHALLVQLNVIISHPTVRRELGYL
jgi:hypothetical protein